MRFIIDEFIGHNRVNHPVKFELVKFRNGDFRIKRAGKNVSYHSDKSAAIEIFNKLKSKFI